MDEKEFRALERRVGKMETDLALLSQLIETRLNSWGERFDRIDTQFEAIEESQKAQRNLVMRMVVGPVVTLVVVAVANFIFRGGLNGLFS